MPKIAVISDIHGNLPALERVVQDIDRRGVDRVVNLGDHVSGPLYPKETVDFLKRQDWIHILGNHDRHLIALPSDQHGPSDRFAFERLTASDLEWLRSLPARSSIGDRILLVHGTPSSDNTYLLETVAHGRTRLASPEEIEQRLNGTAVPLILCGHTHIARMVMTSSGTMIVNPGSVGLPAYEDDRPEYHVVENGSPHARYAVLEEVNDHWRTEIIAVPYDHQKVSRVAGHHGRPDWEYGLRTGFMPSRQK